MSAIQEAIEEMKRDLEEVRRVKEFSTEEEMRMLVSKVEEKLKREREELIKEKDRRKLMQLPKGVYYIGDPCQRIRKYEDDDDDRQAWYDFIDTPEPRGFEYAYMYSHLGYAVFAHPTQWGDGDYDLLDDKNSHIADIWVGSGLIGCMPLETTDLDEDHRGIVFSELNEKINLAYVHEFKGDFECSIYKGMFEIGEFTIDTRGQ